MRRLALLFCAACADPVDMSMPPATCGNGVLDLDEDCDISVTNGHCDEWCREPAFVFADWFGPYALANASTADAACQSIADLDSDSPLGDYPSRRYAAFLDQGTMRSAASRMAHLSRPYSSSCDWPHIDVTTQPFALPMSTTLLDLSMLCDTSGDRLADAPVPGLWLSTCNAQGNAMMLSLDGVSERSCMHGPELYILCVPQED